MPDWAGNFWAICSFFIICLIASHGIFYRFRKGLIRKVFVHITIAMGGLALFAAASESEATVSKRNYDLNEPHVAMLRGAVDQAILNAMSLCRFERVQVDSSPDNFLELIQEEKRACAVSKSIRAESQSWPTAGARLVFPELGQSSFSDEFLTDYFATIGSAIESYNKQFDEQLALRRKFENQQSQILFTILGPFFLAIGLALAFGQVSFSKETD